MSIVTVGIDLAKNVFALHRIDQSGQAVFVKPKVARSQLLEMVANLPPCLIGMEACSGAHHWARLFPQFGHRQNDGTQVRGAVPDERPSAARMMRWMPPRSAKPSPGLICASC